MAGDRLGELSDDLLRRVLHFAPLKEASSTTALSRRWRAPLWLSSGGMNLETGVQNYYHHSSRSTRFFLGRNDFVSGAVGTLDAADGPVTRLTLRLEYTWYQDHRDLVGVVLSHRAARRVEEVRLLFKDKVGRRVTLDSLPFETLRVLELSNCKGLIYETEQAAGLVLPRLSSLRLCHCTQHPTSLQRAIDTAPVLAAVRLESVVLDATAPPPQPKEATTRRLRCPATTMLVLDSCTWKGKIRCSCYPYEKTVEVHVEEIHAPRLRRFRYKGPLRSISFCPLPMELEQVDLEFTKEMRRDKAENKDPDRELETFWRFTRTFTRTKEMRLRVNHLEKIAVLSEARRVELLPAFRRLKRLELQGAHSMKGKAASMAILNLLRCCPVLSSLRINLTAEQHDTASNKKGGASNKKGIPDTRIPQKEIQIAALLGPGHFFQCLKSSLKRVGLQFRLEKSDCLGVKLIKFFAENAMVLEEMHIDGGDEKLYEHMIPKTEKWNSKRRKLGATSFVVLPLKRCDSIKLGWFFC